MDGFGWQRDSKALSGWVRCRELEGGVEGKMGYEGGESECRAAEVDIRPQAKELRKVVRCQATADAGELRSSTEKACLRETKAELGLFTLLGKEQLHLAFTHIYPLHFQDESK